MKPCFNLLQQWTFTARLWSRKGYVCSWQSSISCLRVSDVAPHNCWFTTCLQLLTLVVKILYSSLSWLWIFHQGSYQIQFALTAGDCEWLGVGRWRLDRKSLLSDEGSGAEPVSSHMYLFLWISVLGEQRSVRGSLAGVDVSESRDKSLGSDRTCGLEIHHSLNMKFPPQNFRCTFKLLTSRKKWKSVTVKLQSGFYMFRT